MAGALPARFGPSVGFGDSGLMQSAQHLRQQAEKARRLASGVHDPEVIATLIAYAAECETLAAAEQEPADQLLALQAEALPA